MQSSYWRKCSSCKKEIPFKGFHYVCNVSTCNSPRTGYVFCSVSCFERHVPGARHKDAVAIEAATPAETSTPAAETGRRLIPKAPTTAVAQQSSSSSQEVLVIASRLKDYVQQRSEFNTSASVMDVLSRHLRSLCDRAIENARADGRKTIMDRDFDFLKNR